MKKSFKMTCWNSPSGRWYCNDINNLSKWYVPWRILDISIEEYIDLLLKFNAKDIYYYEPTDYLNFCFICEKDAKSFCSYINKFVRKSIYFL